MKKLSGMVAATAMMMTACGVEGPNDELGQSSQELSAAPSHIHVMKMTNASDAPQGQIIKNAAQTLTNYGGPVLKNVNVIPVYWNSGVAYQTNLNNFYRDFTSSASTTYTMLAQYNCFPGTRGTPYVDTKSTASTTDAAVQTELNRLFTAGAIPLPSANNYYPVHFPAGMNVTDSGGSVSCTQWCAYHGTYVRNGVNVNYGIIPDQGGGCAGGCGSNSLRVNNLTSVSSHELVEATTDPAVGLATTYAPPLAWYNATYGEIGDICNAQQKTVTINGSTYVAQKEWSNSASSCQ